jgi:hypothetical protein
MINSKVYTIIMPASFRNEQTIIIGKKNYSSVVNNVQGRSRKVRGPEVRVNSQ